jgi:hypothetical protein
MKLNKIMYIFFTLTSLTTIVGFLYHPTGISLFLAASVNIISTLLKIGINNSISTELFASSLIADLHLIPAFISFEIYHNEKVAISLILGALIANIFTTILIIIESSKTDIEEKDY